MISFALSDIKAENLQALVTDYFLLFKGGHKVMRDIDKFRGCLIGGDAGDALGYAVEFLIEKQIFIKYGPKGITDYSLIYGVAESLMTHR